MKTSDQKSEVSGQDSIRALLAKHAELVEGNPYCYFELAYTRQTDWCAWLCTAPRETNPDREIITMGQGMSPDEACKRALRNLETEAVK